MECLKASRCTNSQLPKDLIMDIVKSDYDYTVFNIKCLDTNEVFNVEGKTLYQLLSKFDYRIIKIVLIISKLHLNSSNLYHESYNQSLNHLLH